MFSSSVFWLRTLSRKPTTVTRAFSRTSCLCDHETNLSMNETTIQQQNKRRSYKTTRYLSTLNANFGIHPKSARRPLVSKADSREFMAVFPDLIRDLTETGRHLDVPDATKWLNKVLQYNVPSGKKIRGLSVLMAMRHFRNNEPTAEDLKLAQVLGWCVEMLHASFIVNKDMIEGSQTRRGRSCWYKLDEKGPISANDGILLEACLYQLLRQYFYDQPYYLQLLELFHQASLKTALGQSLDALANRLGHGPNFEKFTMSHYNSIVKYKLSYYTFYLPVGLAMHMSGVHDPELHRQAKTILLEMGQFLQTQNDFIDCFGDPVETGRQGRDIQEGKCTWLAVVALQRATPKQREIMEKCYGSNDPEKVNAIKQLYEDIGLPATFMTFEEESYNLISTHIQQVSRGLPHDLFFTLSEMLYQKDD